MAQSPGIICLSQPDDTDFRWVSDGWLPTICCGQPLSKKAQHLLSKVEVAITAGQTVPEVIALLTQAGFAVTTKV